MGTYNCPNCLEDVDCGQVRAERVVAIVCGGHGAHVISLNPMDRETRRAHMDKMGVEHYEQLSRIAAERTETCIDLLSFARYDGS